MNLITFKQKNHFLILIATLLTILTSCSSGPPVYNADTPVISEPLMTQKLVGTSIISASRFFEPWRVFKVRPGIMRGILSYGQHRANVSIPYDANHFRIIYNDSENFSYDHEEQTIHPNYNSWVKKLEKRIHDEIQYQLQLAEQ